MDDMVGVASVATPINGKCGRRLRDEYLLHMRILYGVR